MVFLYYVVQCIVSHKFRNIYTMVLFLKEYIYNLVFLQCTPCSKTFALKVYGIFC